MKYFGPELTLPLQESGRAIKVERVSSAEGADVVFGEVPSVEGAVVFDATGESLEKIRPPAVLVGGHYLSGKAREQLAAKNVQLFSLQSVMLEGFANVCDAVMESAREWPEVRVVISLSVIDASEFPGGLSVRELLYFVQRLRKLKNYAGGAVVGAPVAAAAKIVAELAPQPF